ncbi:DUF5825 family protein [Nonomuraea fuscirosea]|uniref:DUF5825 family protein n=1 Tax=Nonomuraea fuscirosea TaxID=1291556 RepID=UPI003439A145
MSPTVPHVIELELADSFYPGPGDFAIHKVETPVDVSRVLHDNIRSLRMESPIDLRTPESLPALAVIRDATGRGLACDWHLTGADDVAELSYLYPPNRIDGETEDPRLGAWRTGFHIGLLLYRRGPGFVQVRDRREGHLTVYTLYEPAFLKVVELAASPVPVSRLDAAAASELLAANLVLKVADDLLWLPHRIHRWPLPPMAV